MQERYDPWGHRDATSLFKEVGDSAETEYHNDMYVTSKMANRWKEIQWLQIDKRCWEATYGPDTRRLAYLREAKDDDGKSWPEWTGEKRADHHDNEAREKARRELERDIAIPGYSELVGATVGQRMSTAADTTMSHLSTFIFLSHARLKAKQCSVGGSSPPALIKIADDYVRRVRDQIEMIQYIRGRIGEDRSTILDMGRVPGCDTRFPAPSAGQKRVPDSPEYAPVTEDDGAAESARKRPRSSSTVTGSK